MKNYFLLFCFISISTFSLAQADTSTSTVIIKTIAPFTKGDFVVTGNVNYLKNNNGGTTVFNSLARDVQSMFSIELRPQLVAGNDISLGLILGYSKIETEGYILQSWGYDHYWEKFSTLYYGLTGRAYFPIFPRAYAFIALDAFTGTISRIDDEFLGSTAGDQRYFQGAFNPGFSFFVSPAVILELKYCRLGATVQDVQTSVFAEMDLSTLALGASLRLKP